MKKLLSGIGVSPGKLKGKARVINSPGELEELSYGDILVVPTSHPRYALAAMKASALICEIGGKLSHLCVVALEMGIPCVTQVSGALAKIKSGQKIFLDADEGVIYLDE